jgi:hypothetical protein
MVPPPVSDRSPLSSPGPKKETARITVLPDPPAKPLGAVQMKKTQPLSTMPDPVSPISPITVTAAPTPSPTPLEIEPHENGIPSALCWSLLAISAVVLVVQLWIYFG